MGRMLLPRPLAVTSATAAVALVLAACGSTSDASQDPSPSLNMPSSVGATTPTATPTPTATTPTPTAPSSRPTAASPTAPAVKILDFQGIHLMLPVEQGDLPGIPDGLRAALAAGLKKRWDAYGDAPACEKGPVYVVNKVDTGGWASIDTWDDPGVSGPKCAGVGGGYAGFWAIVNGTWQEVIQTQELPQCNEFSKYRFPVAIVGNKCAQPDGTEVAYAG